MMELNCGGNKCNAFKSLKYFIYFIKINKLITIMEKIVPDNAKITTFHPKILVIDRFSSKKNVLFRPDYVTRGKYYIKILKISPRDKFWVSLLFGHSV